MANRSLQDVAEKVMKRKKKPIEFRKLWEEVSAELNFTETEKKSKLAKFYNAMTLDSRFLQLEKNHWDLKNRQSYEKIKINIETFEFEDEDEFEMDDLTEESSDPYEISTAEIY